MEIKMKVGVAWIDPRLTFINLRKTKPTSITLQQKNTIWVPTLMFNNTNVEAIINFNDNNSSGQIIIDPKAKRINVGFDELYNSKKFLGSDG